MFEHRSRVIVHGDTIGLHITPLHMGYCLTVEHADMIAKMLRKAVTAARKMKS